MGKLEYCYYGLDCNCFACYNGKCYCLNKTDFKGGNCPFYKSINEVDKETLKLLGKEIKQENDDIEEGEIVE